MPNNGQTDSTLLDAELVRRARGGDREAFAALYDRTYPMVHALLLTSAPRRLVDDLAQDVFLCALRSLSKLESPERFGPWLCAIARNTARDALRRDGRAPRSEAAPVDEVALTSNEGAGSGVAPERVLVALRELPEAYRETLALRLIEGLSGPEIGARTGRSPGAIRVNLHRGMKLLRERLEGGA